MTSNKRVCILYTGGTIGMVPTEFGYAPKKDYFNTLLNQIHQNNSHPQGKDTAGWKLQSIWKGKMINVQAQGREKYEHPSSHTTEV